MSQHTRRSRAAVALALVTGFALTACGTDDEPPASSGDPIVTEPESEDEE